MPNSWDVPEPTQFGGTSDGLTRVLVLPWNLGTWDPVGPSYGHRQCLWAGGPFDMDSHISVIFSSVMCVGSWGNPVNLSPFINHAALRCWWQPVKGSTTHQDGAAEGDGRRASLAGAPQHFCVLGLFHVLSPSNFLPSFYFIFLSLLNNPSVPFRTELVFWEWKRQPLGWTLLWRPIFLHRGLECHPFLPRKFYKIGYRFIYFLHCFWKRSMYMWILYFQCQNRFL